MNNNALKVSMTYFWVIISIFFTRASTQNSPNQKLRCDHRLWRSCMLMMDPAAWLLLPLWNFYLQWGVWGLSAVFDNYLMWLERSKRFEFKKLSGTERLKRTGFALRMNEQETWTSGRLRRTWRCSGLREGLQQTGEYNNTLSELSDKKVNRVALSVRSMWCE